jgi:hypothetical protein
MLTVAADFSLGSQYVHAVVRGRVAVTASSPFFSEADDAIGVFDEPSDIRWSHPLAAEELQVVVGRPTGNRAPLSNVDRHLLLPRLREEVPPGWQANALHLLTDCRLDQFGRVSSENNSDRMTHLE